MVTVSDQPTARRIWELFAELLDYPRASPVEMLEECRTLTREMSRDAESSLAGFQGIAETTSLGRLQEEYTRAFDMDESHSLYVGYHLLGESYKRSALLLEFKERYRAHGLEVAGELTDYLPVVLRFLAMCDDQNLTDEIVGEAIWPMLEMIVKQDREPDDVPAEEEDRPPSAPVPYHELLVALLFVVRVSPKSDPQPLVSTVDIGWPTT
jgi:nitrate reductase delta subunit